MNRHRIPLLLLFAAALLAACSDSSPPQGSAANNGATNDGQATNNGDELPEGTCVPNRDIWDLTTRPLVESYCGNCHGEQPQFGAPFSLMDYDDLVAGSPGSRKVDRMAVRMADKTMPPPGTLVPHADLDTLVLWASCGELHPDHSVGLSSTAPVFEAPEEAPDGLDHFDLKAGDFAVGQNVLDLYQCFTFDVPVDAARFIRRMEPIVDDARVLHHIVVLKDIQRDFEVGAAPCQGMPDGSVYLYAWAPGAGAIEFPDGGLRVEPGDRYVVQIHYNNGAGVPDAVDDSGMRFWIAEPEGPEYTMIAPGPLNFNIPAGGVTEVTGTCRIPSAMTVLAGMPHMHEVGTEFRQVVARRDGTEEPLIELTGWAFELQYFYHMPMELEAGDSLITTCTFDNQGTRAVHSGARTQDEMCFDFMYVTPPQSFAYCDSIMEDDPTEFAYAPGQCAGPDALSAVEEIRGAVSTEEPPTLTGGELADGRYTLNTMALHVPANTPIGEPDLEASFLRAAGQLGVESGVIALDGTFLAHLVVGTLEIDRPFTISYGGSVVAGGAEGAGVLQTTCPQAGEIAFNYQADANTVTLQFRSNQSGVMTVSVLTFERVP